MTSNTTGADPSTTDVPASPDLRTDGDVDADLIDASVNAIGDRSPDDAAPSEDHAASGGSRRPAIPARLTALRRWVAVVPLAILVLAGALIAFGSFRGGPGAPSGAGALLSAAPTFGFAGRSMGYTSAPVTIEVWADFQCPFCGLFAHGVEPSVEREFATTGRAVVTYRDFAFLGQESRDAAVAARCAGEQGAFWRYHDLLFASQRGENQGGFSRDVLIGLAKFAALDTPAFTACLDDPVIATAVATETSAGQTLGVSSTPTLRVVGPGGSELIMGVSDLARIGAAVERRANPATSTSPDASSRPVPASPNASDIPNQASPGSSSPTESASPKPSSR